VEKGEPGRPAPTAEAFHVNAKDRAWVDSKTTPQPNGVALQPIKLTGAREKVAKKTYIRAAKYPQPAFDQALAECKADKSWRTFEATNSGHDVMVDAPEWLVDVLLQVSCDGGNNDERTDASHRAGRDGGGLWTGRCGAHGHDRSNDGTGADRGEDLRAW